MPADKSAHEELSSYIQAKVDPYARESPTGIVRKAPRLFDVGWQLHAVSELAKIGPDRYFEGIVKKSLPKGAMKILSLSNQEIEGIPDPPVSAAWLRKLARNSVGVLWGLVLAFGLFLFVLGYFIGAPLAVVLSLLIGVSAGVLWIYARIKHRLVARVEVHGIRLNRETKLAPLAEFRIPEPVRLLTTMDRQTIPCPNCNGTATWSEETRCAPCGGTGNDRKDGGICSFCNGSGRDTVHHRCSTCKGGTRLFQTAEWIATYNIEARDLNASIERIVPKAEAVIRALRQLIEDANQKIIAWTRKSASWSGMMPE